MPGTSQYSSMKAGGKRGNSDPLDWRHKLDLFWDDNSQIQYLRLHWTDLSGVMRTRIVTAEQGQKMARGELDYTLAQNCMVIPILPAPQAFIKGPETWDLVPDWSSLRPCGQNLKHAMVICFTTQRGRTDESSKCPRTLLKATLARYPSDAIFEMGIELEFVLLDRDFNIASSLDRIAGQSTMAGLRGSNMKILEEIECAMRVSKIQMYHMHTEGKDQLEIALNATSPMEAIDNYMYTAEIIRAVCIEHGLRATLTPKPILVHDSHNGVHVHLSCNKEKTMQAILASSLEKLPALCAIGIANVDGYVRVADDEAGRWIGYGTSNRDLPIRQISPSHFEFRFVDATANIYLYAAALLQGGLNESPREFRWRDCQVQPKQDGSNLAEYGITQLMPVSLEEALRALRNDVVLQTWLGMDLYEQYTAIKMHEIHYAIGMSEEARRLKFLAFF